MKSCLLPLILKKWVKQYKMLTSIELKSGIWELRGVLPTQQMKNKSMRQRKLPLQGNLSTKHHTLFSFFRKIIDRIKTKNYIIIETKQIV